MLIIAHASIVGPEAEARLLPFATDDDRRVANRYRAPRRRAQSLGARTLLRSVLEQATGRPAVTWRLFANSDGQPRASCDDCQVSVEVSLSHSCDLVACAVTSRGPVGIDIQHCAGWRNFAALAAVDFGKREAQAVARGGASLFYRIWTLREALAKASGTGFPLTQTDRDLFFDPPVEGSWRGTAAERDWIFMHRVLPEGYSLAAAVAA